MSQGLEGENMDLNQIMDNAIKLSARRDKLSSLIDSEVRGEHYATVEGYLAFKDGNYQSERGYNNSVLEHKKSKENFSDELKQLSTMIINLYQAFENTTATMSKGQLQDSLVQLEEKRVAKQMEIAELAHKKDTVLSKGKNAFNAGEYQSEKEYNEMYSKYNSQINDINAELNYFDYFEGKLNYRINNYTGHPKC